MKYFSAIALMMFGLLMGYLVAEIVPLGDDKINKITWVENRDAKLTDGSFIIGDEAFLQIHSSLITDNAIQFWNDIVYLDKKTSIRKIYLLINSPGGESFAGLAIVDYILYAQSIGFEINAHASGVIASAALPIFAVCNKRYSTPDTIFMVHRAQWRGADGIQSVQELVAQNKVLNLVRERYLTKLADYSNLDKDEWGKMQIKKTWFGVDQAMEWGLIDEIE